MKTCAENKPVSKNQEIQAMVKSARKKYHIALTMGDPAGIGPEIIVKAFQHWQPPKYIALTVYGDTRRLRLAAKISGGAIKPIPAIRDFKNTRENLAWGKISKSAGKAAGQYIESAITDALSGKVDAIVTAPIHKAAFSRAGYPWAGHTDMLEYLCEVPATVMMLASKQMRVAVLTHHIPLAEVPKAIDKIRLTLGIQVFHNGLRQYGIFQNPRIAVCGLNPHAGESGRFGLEEKNIITPVILRARKSGMDVSGPHPADTVFVRHLQGEFDAVLTMYHDQGLIPLKLNAFGKAANVTLGLPFVRTSVDHGTAFDLAGSGKAKPDSLLFATKYAISMLRQQEKVADLPRNIR
ncbi:4-hydroxythreonine-4-phosphate dehydrogenase PdxA [Planctomycetota bacterium]